MSNKSKARSRRWQLLLPLIVVVILALLWSVFWFYAFGQVQAAVDRAIERAAASGRHIACDERTHGGFPFRFIITCEGASVAVHGANIETLIAMRRASFVAQAYAPNHIIGEFKGPLIVGRVDDPSIDEIQIDWAHAQGSILVDRSSLEPVDARLVVQTPHLGQLSARENRVPRSLISADRFELYARAAAASQGLDANTMEIVSRADLVHVPGAASPSRGRMLTARHVALEAVVTHVPNIMEHVDSLSVPILLKAWQNAGGQFELSRFHLVGPNLVVGATADLSLDELGRPQGEITTQLAASPPDRSNLDAPQASISMLLSALQVFGTPTEYEKNKATEFKFDLREGQIFLGPLMLEELPRLF